MKNCQNSTNNNDKQREKSRKNAKIKWQKIKKNVKKKMMK